MTRTLEAIVLGLLVVIAYVLLLSYVLAGDVSPRAAVLHCSLYNGGQEMLCEDCTKYRCNLN